MKIHLSEKKFTCVENPIWGTDKITFVERNSLECIQLFINIEIYFGGEYKIISLQYKSYLS